MRQRGVFWENDEQVRRIADPYIERKKKGPLKAKTLQDELSYLFDETVRTDKEAHWMVLIYMHTELENNSIWSLPPLYTQEKMSSVFNFIYHLSNDLGNVTVMKGLAQRGHSPRLYKCEEGTLYKCEEGTLYKCEEGTLHYPNHTHTLWADVGNSMYGYMHEYLNLVSDAPGIGHEQAGDVVEIAYNL